MYISRCVFCCLWLMVTLSPYVVRANIDAPDTITIPAGPYITGSDRVEREAAYLLDEAAYGHSRTREWRWYENERARKTLTTDAFRITRTLITNRAYAAFIRDSDHPAPDVDAGTWDSYGLIHPFERTRRHAWTNRTPPDGREEHPVVLVSLDDALAYAAWLSHRTGVTWRLPTEEEWEKAARGTDGRRFPWGEDFAPLRLNSHDAGSFDTMPVDSFPTGLSPYGMADAAGQVFEWTSSTYTPDRYVVKGGSWDDKGCGICRPAARHTRPRHLKHILIGFRLVTDSVGP